MRNWLVFIFCLFFLFPFQDVLAQDRAGGGSAVNEWKEKARTIGIDEARIEEITAKASDTTAAAEALQAEIYNVGIDAGRAAGWSESGAESLYGDGMLADRANKIYENAQQNIVGDKSTDEVINSMVAGSVSNGFMHTDEIRKKLGDNPTMKDVADLKKEISLGLTVQRARELGVPEDVINETVGGQNPSWDQIESLKIANVKEKMHDNYPDDPSWAEHNPYNIAYRDENGNVYYDSVEAQRFAEELAEFEAANPPDDGAPLLIGASGGTQSAAGQNDQVFGNVENTLRAMWYNVLKIIYLIAAIGYIGIGTSAFFGKFDWKWFWSATAALMFISVTLKFIEWLTGESMV